MSLQAKIKDEPLDPGYGDVIAKTEPVTTSESNDMNNERCSIRIKSEILDSPNKNQTKVKSEPEDFPDDFFDCLNDNNFLDEIALEQGDGNENDAQISKRADVIADTDANNDDEEIIEDPSLREEIEKLSKIIERRKQKIALRASAVINSKSSSSKSVESSELITTLSEKRIKSELRQLEKGDHEKEKQKSKSERDARKSERHCSEDEGAHKRYRRSRSSSQEKFSKRRRSRSGSRSDSRSRSPDRHSSSRSHRRGHSSRSRYRRKTRSRSQSRSKQKIRIRSVSRSRSRSRSLSPYSHSRSRHRSRSRSFDRNHSKSRKKSFLEELKETLAQKGMPFTEEEQIEINKKDLMREYLRSESLQQATTSSKESEMINNLNQFMPMPIKIKSDPELENKNKESFPLPIQIKVEPMDINESEKVGEEEKVSFPRPMIIKQERMDEEEPVKSKPVKVKEEKFEVPFKRRERVLNICGEAIKKLYNYEQKKPITKFLYTPTVIRQNDFAEKLENRSPLNRINNVKFKFNSAITNIDVKLYGITNLPEGTTKVACLIGFDAMHITEKLNHKDLPYSLKMLKKANEDIKPEKFYKPFYTSTATQTDTYSCSTCIIRQLRKYQDIGVQIEPFVEDHCTQVDQQTIAEEFQKLVGSVMSMQHYRQPHQQYYPPSNANHQQQMMPMMYNNYTAPQGPQQTNQFMQPYPYYQGQSMTGYGHQSSAINNTNNPMLSAPNPALFPQPQQHYTPPKSHPGPRTLPSRSNLVIPKSSSNIHRDK